MREWRSSSSSFSGLAREVFHTDRVSVDWGPKSQVSFRRFGSGDKQVLGSGQRACWEQASSTKGSVADEHGTAGTGFVLLCSGYFQASAFGLEGKLP